MYKKIIFKYFYQIILLLLLIFSFSCDYIDLLLFEYPNFNPKYSLDGKSLIFNIEYNNNSKIFLFNKETGDLKIFNDKDKIFERVYVPSFSKDGKYITFAKYFKKSKTFEIFIMKSDGTEIKQLTNNNQIPYVPIFSNNEQKIFFGMKPEIRSIYQWYSIDIDTLEQKKICNDKFIHAMNPAITSDNRYIIFADTDLSKVDESIEKMKSGKQEKKPDAYSYQAEKIVRLEINTGKTKYLMFGNQIRPVVTKGGSIIFSGYQKKTRKFYGKEYPAYELGVYQIDINGNNFKQILSGEKIDNLLKNTVGGIYKDDHFSIKTLRLSPDDEKNIFFESGNHKFYEVSLDGKEKREIIFNKKRIRELFKKKE